MTETIHQQLAQISQRIRLGNEREQEDDGSGNAVLSAWSMFATIAQHDTPRLVAALTAVLNRHRPVIYTGWRKWLRTAGKLPAYGPICTVCETPYPCAEIEAVAVVLKEK